MHMHLVSMGEGAGRGSLLQRGEPGSESAGILSIHVASVTVLRNIDTRLDMRVLLEQRTI